MVGNPAFGAWAAWDAEGRPDEECGGVLGLGVWGSDETIRDGFNQYLDMIITGDYPPSSMRAPAGESEAAREARMDSEALRRMEWSRNRRSAYAPSDALDRVLGHLSRYVIEPDAHRPSVLVRGSRGSGRTTLLTALYRMLVNAPFESRRRYECRRKNQGGCAPEFVGWLSCGRDSLSFKRGWADEDGVSIRRGPSRPLKPRDGRLDPGEVTQLNHSAPFLLVDNLGRERAGLSAAAAAILLDRCARWLPTFVTTELDPAGIRARYGDELAEAMGAQYEAFELAARVPESRIKNDRP